MFPSYSSNCMREGERDRDGGKDGWKDGGRKKLFVCKRLTMSEDRNESLCLSNATFECLLLSKILLRILVMMILFLLQVMETCWLM